MSGWVTCLNETVLGRYRTRLRGGFPEPFYRASRDDRPAEIRYTRDYERSALHELAHWCIAGEARRTLDDYGYWYQPDGRSEAQQLLFYRVEVKPQALEKHFCTALDLDFDISADNLGHSAAAGIERFRLAVDAEYAAYHARGLPSRAREICDCLLQWRSKQGKQHAA